MSLTSILLALILASLLVCLGDMLDMRFVIDDQDRVDVPAALEDALNARPELRAIWERTTPGKRRGLAHRVAQAKTSGTVLRRIQEVIDILQASR